MLLYGALLHRPSLSDIFEGDPEAGKKQWRGLSSRWVTAEGRATQRED